MTSQAGFFKYPKQKKNFFIRARDLSVKNNNIKKNFQKVLNRISKHGIFILGKEVESFEKKLAKFLGVKYAVAVSSGTSALYLTLKCLDLKKGDEIITTPMSWLVTSTVIKIIGAKPVFADVDSDYNLDPLAINKLITSKTKAILPVHFYGKIAQINEIRKIAKSNNLFLIEDVAQAFGTSLNGIKAGTFGDFGTFSFSPMKVFGSFGDAGAIVFKDKKYLNLLKSLRTCGTVNSEICNVAEIKHNIDAIQAAFIKENFNIYDDLKKRRIEIAKRYTSKLNPKFYPPQIEDQYTHSFYDYTILVENRDEVIKYMYKNGIEVKVRHPILINHQKVFKDLPEYNLPNANYYISRILSLPMHYNLKNNQIDFICKKLNEI